MENEYKRDANTSKTPYKEKTIYNEKNDAGTTFVILGTVAVLAVGAYFYHAHTSSTNPADIEPAAGTSYEQPNDGTGSSPGTRNQHANTPNSRTHQNLQNSDRFHSTNP